MTRKQAAALAQLVEVLKPRELQVLFTYCDRAFWETDALIRGTSGDAVMRRVLERRARLLVTARRLALKKLGGAVPDGGGSNDRA
ncbi:hypothetical protein [Anaeromyxobacter dehalogenans]|uniref:Uncharacterized protein n=1 Tax=Anaeromyxobacter dehalogenans (strain 2CP-C) TaxID=290397 RepID=Q2IIX6_ANADE|nr:hypothetical protein [Anaeromyxobacter dehalogenans]ABC81609.1 hypothetical protein Adeh_1837 [Anaeromyxobacter dehalogenans 2CP-C]